MAGAVKERINEVPIREILGSGWRRRLPFRRRCWWVGLWREAPKPHVQRGKPL